MRAVVCFLLGLALFSQTAIATPQDSEPLSIIQNIQVTVGKDHQSVNLKLSTDYSETITYLYDTGVFTAILPKTKIAPTLGNLRVNNQFITQIRLRAESDRTLVEIRFADPQFNPVGKITHQARFDQLEFLVYHKKPAPSVINGPVKELKSAGTAPTKQRLKSPEGPNESLGSLSGMNDLTPGLDHYAIIQMLIALALILGLIYGSLWVYNRTFAKKLNFKKGPYQIKVASTFHLNSKQKVVVLEINEMAFACSVTAQQISVIAQVDRGDFEQFMGSHHRGSKDSIDFALLRDEYRQSRLSVAQEPVARDPQPKLSFAAELLDKVKRLKPID